MTLQNNEVFNVDAMSSKIKICKEEGCHNSQTTTGYCRLHYLKNWKKIRKKAERVAAERLNKYVERMVRQFPDKYVEEIKKDLRTRHFEQQMEEEFGELDSVFRLFNDPNYNDEINQLIHDLKIEKDF